MILDYYRIFYYVAQYKSFSKAAEVMGNNQPNITRCMNILENELGCKLFIRSNRGVQLTVEGERLHNHVSIAIEQLVAGENELLKEKGLESGLVNIGASETALRLILLTELESFHHQYPHVKLRISNHSTPQAIQALENGLVDFAVITTPIALKKPLQRIPLFSFREILLGGPEFADIASTPHHLADLQDIPLVGIGPGTSTHELYTQFFMRHNLPFSPDMEVATTDQVFPLIQHNLGIGFFPEALAAEHIAMGKVVQIPLLEALPERKICLIRNVKRPQSIAARCLEEHLTSHREKAE